MAHLVEHMAYVGRTPWHGLGNQLAPRQPLEVWARQAGMEWDILESPVHFAAGSRGSLSQIMSFEDHKVLFRSDNKAPLSVVGNRYQVVQPREILEFYRDLTEQSGFELETAGVLKGGRKLWALARTGQSGVIKGNDRPTPMSCWPPPATALWPPQPSSPVSGWCATTPWQWPLRER